MSLRRARIRRGMTLIEVMVSLAILGMMVLSIWQSFKGTTKGIESTEEVQKHYSIIRNGLARMTSELSMAYLSFNRPLDDPKHYTYFEGIDGFEEDELTFSAFAHQRIRKDSNESDQSVIRYELQPDPDDRSRTHLYRRESRRLDGELPEDLENFYPAYVVIEDVVAFDVKYWDNREEDWIDEWRTTRVDSQPDRLPQRVWIKLEVKTPGGDIEEFHTQVPLMMQERIDLSK